MRCVNFYLKVWFINICGQFKVKILPTIKLNKKHALGILFHIDTLIKAYLIFLEIYVIIIIITVLVILLTNKS